MPKFMPDSPELLQNPVLQNVKKRADGDLCKGSIAGNACPRLFFS
jgi:hypothetical protein